MSLFRRREPEVTLIGPLPELPAFQLFQEGIGDRCDEPPVVTELDTIGSFRLM